MVEVIPAILEKEFPEIEKKIKSVEGLVEWVQIDIADNSLVPNTTFLDPEPFRKFNAPQPPLTVRGGEGELRGVNLELHMMVKDPLMYLERFNAAGFTRFFAHVEGGFVDEYIAKCYQLGVEVGLAIDGPTDLAKIRDYLDNIDCVLVMAIEAGESGRPFREDTIEKIRKIREIDLEIPIAVDGAMGPENAGKVIAAGAIRINSNSFIFSSTDVKMAIEQLKK